MRIITLNSARAVSRFNLALESLEEARGKSNGIRGKVAAAVADIDLSSYALSPVLTDDCGYNRLPLEPRAALERLVDPELAKELGSDKHADLLEFIAERNLDPMVDLQSRTDVVHAEIDAMMKSLHSDFLIERNALLVTASPCINCSRYIYEFMPDLQALFFTGAYRCEDGVDFLGRMMPDLKIHGVDVNGGITLLEDIEDYRTWCEVQ